MVMLLRLGDMVWHIFLKTSPLIIMDVRNNFFNPTFKKLSVGFISIYCYTSFLPSGLQFVFFFGFLSISTITRLCCNTAVFILTFIKNL